jgi:DNA repair exonuclease SbcCD nuclease subunit
LAELAAKGYQYWALGHVHDFEVVSDSPYVVFPGNLQGRSVRECGPKGAVIVTVKDGAVAKPPEHFSLDSVRWALIQVDVTGTTNETELHSRIRESLELAIEMEGEGRSLVARVALDGATPLHGWLTERRDQVQNDIRAIAVSISDGLWIEKMTMKTIAVAQVSASASTVLDELSALLVAESENPELRMNLKEKLAEFLSRVPSDLASENDLLASISQGEHQILLESATTALITRLESAQ